MMIKFMAVFGIAPENGVECESFTTIFIDSLVACENKYYLLICLDNCFYKIA